MSNQDLKSTGGLIPQEFIQKILDTADIFEFASQKISLKKAATHRYKGLCPFHNEKTPSFYIHQDKQFYHCYGCGANGNIITLMMHLNNATFPEAIEELAQKHNFDMPQRNHDPQQQEFFKTAKNILERTNALFVSQLNRSNKALQYFKSRGLRTEIIQKFQLGYAPVMLPKNFLAKDELQIATTVGVIFADCHPNQLRCYFKERVMFPIHNPKGHVIGFGGRTLGEQQPKYLNSKESQLFHKSNILYGMHQARQAKNDYLIVVEGYMDVLMLANFDINNAVATLGTAVTTLHLKSMLKYTKKVAFCFDGDEAGQKAAWKALTQALPVIVDGIELKFIFMPAGYDPDSYLNDFGKAKFKELFKAGLNFADYFFQQLQLKYPPSSVEKKAILGQHALALINQMQNSLIKQLLTKNLERILDMELGGTPQKTSAQPTSQATSFNRNSEHAKLKLLLALMIQNPEIQFCKLVPKIIVDQQILLCKILKCVVDLTVSFGCKTTASLIEASKSGSYHEEIKTLAFSETHISDNIMQSERSKLLDDTELIFISYEINQLLATLKQKPDLDGGIKSRLQALLKRKARISEQQSH